MRCWKTVKKSLSIVQQLMEMFNGTFTIIKRSGPLFRQASLPFH